MTVAPSVLPPVELLTSQKGVDGHWHAHYPTATRTLCGQDLTPFKPGRKWLPTCGSCSRVARLFDCVDQSMPEQWRQAA